MKIGDKAWNPLGLKDKVFELKKEKKVCVSASAKETGPQDFRK